MVKVEEEDGTVAETEAVDETVVAAAEQEAKSFQMSRHPQRTVARCIKNTENVHFTVLAPLVARGQILNINQWTNEIASMTLI